MRILCLFQLWDYITIDMVVCIKVFMAITGKEFCLFKKTKQVIVYVIYVNSIIVLYIL